jgi:hypothetical protein
MLRTEGMGNVRAGPALLAGHRAWSDQYLNSLKVLDVCIITGTSDEKILCWLYVTTICVISERYPGQISCWAMPTAL